MQKYRGRYTKTGLERYLYACHKFGAKRRGIPFQLTFEQWRDWWFAQLGPNWISKRGNKPEQYHMARYGDIGPYSLDNIKCITARQNRKEGGSKLRGEASGRVSKLTAKQVMAIRKAKGFQYEIAKKFGVCQANVSFIKNNKRWKHI